MREAMLKNVVAELLAVLRAELRAEAELQAEADRESKPAAADREIKPMAFYTYTEVSALLAVHIQTIKNAVGAEHLIPKYVGSEPRIQGSELLRWLEEGGRTGRSRRTLAEEKERAMHKRERNSDVLHVQ